MATAKRDLTDPKVQGRAHAETRLPRLLTVEEAAAVLRVTPEYVTRRLVFEKRLAYVKVGRQVLFEEKVLADFIAERTVTPSAYGAETTHANGHRSARPRRNGKRRN